MNDLIKYLESALGVETAVSTLEKQLYQQLPLYVTSTFKVNELTIYNHRICFLIAENLDNVPTPDQLFKQMIFLRQKLGLPVVYVFNTVASYNIKRLIKKGVNFIIPYKQLFIPDLFMDLRNPPKTFSSKKVLFTPLAQFLLLYHLQKERLNGFTSKRLTDKFVQPYRSVCRAVNNLKELELCNLVGGGKEKYIQFAAKDLNLWKHAQKFLQNPVERIIFTDEILDEKPTCLLSNINALCNLTMINDEKRRYYAISKTDFKNLAVETNKYAGDNTIELWRYDPYLLSNNGFVDKLSLYLLFRNDADERVQGELEKMINQIKWLEE